MKDDTIAAIATPLGEGGLAVIRISGPDALAVADGVFAAAGSRAQRPSEVPSHRVLYGRVVRGGRVIDEVLLTVMRAPRTFTREDVVEISGHGGVLVTRSILEAVLAQGARLAEPGEFTRRAFLSGRIDLTQAEAVADLIQARTELARVAATEQLSGHLSRRIEAVRTDLVSIQAHVEAHLDFPEEDIAPDTREQLERRLRAAVAELDRLLSTAREGEILRHGLRVAIVGRPNAGKSSLLNQLLGLDRAIVSAVPGTTRDTIEATASVRGLPVILVDTAGLRDVGDPVEEEGVRRSRLAIERADLILYVVDASEPWAGADRENLEALAAQRPLVVLNKVDLPRRAVDPGPAVGDTVCVSALTGAGIEVLRDAIQGRVWRGEIGAEMLQVMINARHEDALRRAREALRRAADGLHHGAALDGVALETRLGVLAVGEVVGRTTTEDLLDRIFSTFCIGK